VLVAVRDREAQRGQAVARGDRQGAAQQRAADAAGAWLTEHLRDPRAAVGRLTVGSVHERRADDRAALGHREPAAPPYVGELEDVGEPAAVALPRR